METTKVFGFMALNFRLTMYVRTKFLCSGVANLKKVFLLRLKEYETFKIGQHQIVVTRKSTMRKKIPESRQSKRLCPRCNSVIDFRVYRYEEN
jgi:hypothetical protein